MKIAGIWPGHDCSFCILEDGKPTIHAELERYNREKSPPGDAIKFMFDRVRSESKQVSHFASVHPLKKTKQYEESFSAAEKIASENGGKFHFFSHHRAHAANAFYSSNLNENLEKKLKASFGGLSSDLFEIDSNKILDEKLAQWNSYESIKSSLEKFIKMISNAETIEEITKSYEFLQKNVPVKIDGLDGNPMDRVNKIVSANYNKIKNDKEALKKLIDAAGIKVKDSGNGDEIKEIDAKKAILKVQVFKEIENANKLVNSSEFKKSINKMLSTKKSIIFRTFINKFGIILLK